MKTVKTIKLIFAAAIAAVFFAGTIYTSCRDLEHINSDAAAIFAGSSDAEVSEVVSASDDAININTATVEELCTLKGIGTVRAEAIIKYREENGGFISTEELTRVKGIGEGIYNNIKENIRI